MIEIKKKQSSYYSPLRYPGGKAILANFIDKIIQKTIQDSCTYVEPYAGGGGVGLTLLFHETVDHIILNDFDKAIYSFWHSVLNENSRFQNKIRKVNLTITEWEKQKKINLTESDDLFKLGFSTFFLNRTNRSGILTGGPIGGKAQKGEWKIDARFNKDALIERIKKIGKYKNRITLLHEDGITLTERLICNDDYFIYLDPPYVNKGSYLYLNHYLESDHKKLAILLNKNRLANWVLSYDNVDLIRNLYKARYQEDFDLVYHASKVRNGSELLIFSDLIKKRFFC